ncbi:hypothetical protein C7293_05505 [filamentous cyanobacterium CCT1]|nr:hypothetical protein C7293_05505 [filamentous cyanobacterium CCT1]PSN81030.1 hypothetical protein C8B47_03430 [filamentous cyanobacterium CCP4]
MPLSFSLTQLEKAQNRFISILVKFSVLGVAVTAIAIGFFAVKWLYAKEWSGLGEGSTVSTTLHKRDADGNVVETTQITRQPRKTLWDSLELLGIPVSLVILGYIFQQQQQKRLAKEAREDFLQVYFDRLSSILANENLVAKDTILFASNKEKVDDPPIQKFTPEQETQLSATVNIIRARTLSILRKFEKDGDLKRNIILFLIDSEVISELKLSLSGANCRNIDLSGTSLKCIDFRGADFSNAKLLKTDFSGADLRDVDFSGADLSWANFEGAKIGGAIFKKAQLLSTNLENTIFSDNSNLDSLDSSGNADFSNAKFTGVNMRGFSLRHFEFSGAKFRYVNLEDADLEYAYFHNASFKKVNLKNAKLNQAEFFRADLRGANLSGASLSGSYFTLTNLRKTILNDADLSKTSLTKMQLMHSKICRTTLPDGITLDPNRDCEELGIDPDTGEDIGH